jgi:hypothetical protein
VNCGPRRAVNGGGSGNILSKKSLVITAARPFLVPLQSVLSRLTHYINDKPLQQLQKL